MADINVVMLTGRLGKDVEMTESEKAHFAKSSLAVKGEKWGDKETPTYWLPIEIVGKKHEDGTDDRAKWFQKNFAKGDPVVVTGLIIEDTWEDRETGQKKSKHKIKISEIRHAEYGKPDVPLAFKAAAAFIKGKSPELMEEFKAFLAAQTPAPKPESSAPVSDADIPAYTEPDEDEPF